MKLNMKLKILLLTVFILFLSISTVTITTIHNIHKKAVNDLKIFKKDQIELAKKNLKNYVDIAYKTIETSYLAIKDKKYIEKLYGLRLKNIIDAAESIIKSKLKAVKEGRLTIEAAKAASINDIKLLRYDSGIGYVWINDMGEPIPKMIMHPTVSALNGKILDNSKYNCALGVKKNLFVAMVEVCKKKKEGFVDYMWPKPSKDGLTKDQPKLSFVRLFEQWGWVLGTGIYVDDVQKDVKDKIKSDIQKMRYDSGTGYFWINDTSYPYSKMIMHPTAPALDGIMLNHSKYNCALGEKKNLFTAMVEICQKNSEGFVDYMWPKPKENGLTTEQPKLSFVKLYKPLNWIVGTGIYIDDIDEKVKAQDKLIEE